MANNGNIYEITTNTITSDVTEVSVTHTDYSDRQIEVEAYNLLITPSGVFLVTDQGLQPIRNEDRLWEAIPKIDLGLPNNEEDICFSDFHVANEVVEYLKGYIKKVCPDWDILIPGRRQSRRR